VIEGIYSFAFMRENIPLMINPSTIPANPPRIRISSVGAFTKAFGRKYPMGKRIRGTSRVMNPANRVFPGGR
jgi:hypothetical protein